VVKDFSVNILGLSKGVHQFDFHLDDNFFKNYGSEVIQKGSFDAKVILDKKETFIEAQFDLKGFTELICDRSLEPFQYPITISKKMVFKYGDEEKEVSDEIMIIPAQKDKLDVGQFIYEYILLEIPMKKLHPRFSKDDEDEGSIVYSSSDNEDEENDDEPIDPRWEALKKLN
jgi:uncharacterized metal-binding protein YceD (DUF177 family)